MKKNTNFIKSVKHAFKGIRSTAARERNFRVQILIAIFVVILCILFQVDSWHFVMVCFAIFFVLASELFNTAIEAVVDLITQGKPHPLAKIAKDASAGAVLLAAIFSAGVGGVVLYDVVSRFL